MIAASYERSTIGGSVLINPFAKLAERYMAAQESGTGEHISQPTQGEMPLCNYKDDCDHQYFDGEHIGCAAYDTKCKYSGTSPNA